MNHRFPSGPAAMPNGEVSGVGMENSLTLGRACAGETRKAASTSQSDMRTHTPASGFFMTAPSSLLDRGYLVPYAIVRKSPDPPNPKPSLGPVTKTRDPSGLTAMASGHMAFPPSLNR